MPYDAFKAVLPYIAGAEVTVFIIVLAVLFFGGLWLRR